jgi:hypothetical protein
MVNTHALIPAPLVSKPGQRVVNPGSTWSFMVRLNLVLLEQ